MNAAEAARPFAEMRYGTEDLRWVAAAGQWVPADEDLVVDDRLGNGPAGRPPVVHRFDDSGTAYDTSQWYDGVKDGDVLVVHRPGSSQFAERSVAILLGAWPVTITPGLVTDRDTAFQTPVPGHTVEDVVAAWCAEGYVDTTPEDYAASLQLARAEQAKL